MTDDKPKCIENRKDCDLCNNYYTKSKEEPSNKVINITEPKPKEAEGKERNKKAVRCVAHASCGSRNEEMTRSIRATANEPRPLENGDCLKNCPYIQGENRCKVFCIKDIRSALEFAEDKVWKKVIDCDETGDIVEPDDVVNIYRQAFQAVLKEGEG